MYAKIACFAAQMQQYATNYNKHDKTRNRCQWPCSCSEDYLHDGICSLVRSWAVLRLLLFRSRHDYSHWRNREHKRQIRNLLQMKLLVQFERGGMDTALLDRAPCNGRGILLHAAVLVIMPLCLHFFILSTPCSTVWATIQGIHDLGAHISREIFCDMWRHPRPLCTRRNEKVVIHSGRAPNPTTKGVLQGSRAKEQRSCDMSYVTEVAPAMWEIEGWGNPSGNLASEPNIETRTAPVPKTRQW